MKNYLFGAIALIFVGAASCKKGDDSNGNGNPPARQDTLIAGKWRTTAITATTNFFGKDTTFDLYSTFNDCEKDNLTLFRSDAHLITDEGATKCNSADLQQTDEGTWKFDDAASTLTLNTGGQTLDGIFKVTSLSGTSLQVQRDSSVSGITAHVIVTYTNQK